MTADVLLVINCQEDRSYGNRRVLRAIYGDRFPHVLFAVGGGCVIDTDCPTIATAWRPRLLDNACACCDPRTDPHPAGRHATHPRLVDVARFARVHGFEIVVFAEDDCLLAPAIGPASIRARLDGLDALVPYVGFCDRDSTSWLWTRHATGYSAYDVVAPEFDRNRLLRHWSEFSGEPPPPVLYAPMFGGFVDVLAFRTDLLLRMVPDLLALQDVWHEAAIPTALMHRTPRIGGLEGAALWGEDRNRPRGELFAMLAGRDYVHPIKLSLCPGDEALAAYRRVAPAGMG